MLRSPSLRFLFCALLAIPLLSVLLLAGACSDSTAPGQADDGTGRIGAEGSLDPATGTFVLKTLDLPPPWDGPSIRVQLIGSNLSVDRTTEQISLDVAIRNFSGRTLYAPAVVWIEGFTPESVTVVNPDLTLIPPSLAATDTSFAYWVRYGFDYSRLLGEDGALDHEATSETKTWIFHDPDLASFSFQGWAEFGMEPERPRIAGRCFVDFDRDGVPDPNEPPLQGAFIVAHGPDGEAVRVQPDERGYYTVPVERPGLYSIACNVALEMPPFRHWTTPNPLEVLLTPGTDGVPNSFLAAHFGQAGYDSVPVPMIEFTDRTPDDLIIAPWSLLEASIDRQVLRMHVGLSGCQPDHPFSLWMSGGFMESEPVQVNIVLVNELEEDCDAWFERELEFDLGPLQEAYMQAYGPGELVLNLIQPDGTQQELIWGIFPPD